MSLPLKQYRRLRTVLVGAAVLALAALGRPGAAGDDPAAKPAVPSSELVKAGAVWDAPPDPLSISLAADGTISLLGHEVGLVELVERLSEATRDPSHREPYGSSSIDVVLRVAPALPWTVVQWVMQACADVNVQMLRVHFAVVPEIGGAEGVIPMFLSRVGSHQPVVLTPDPSVRAALSASEGVADRGAVFAALQASLATTTNKTVEIVIPFLLLPRAGHVLSIFDLALRAGATNVKITGARSSVPDPVIAAIPDPPGEPGSLAWIRAWVAAHAKGDPAGLKVRVDRTSIDATSPSSPLPAPPPRRARSACGAYVDPAARPEERLVIGGGAHAVFGERGGRRPASSVSPDVRARESVDRALAWLAAHQNPDGGWEAATFGRWCDRKDSGAPESIGAGDATYDVGVTGLVLLAFLGAGYTNQFDWEPLGKVVGNGLKYLRNAQDAEGCFGPRTTPHFAYNHAIATLALVEAYGMTGSSIYKGATQKGLDFSAAMRNPGLAWRYGVKPGDNDTSVTGWMTLALAVAKMINDARVGAEWPPALTIDAAAFDGARAWIDKMTDPASGRVGYQQRGTSPARPADRVDAFPGDRSEALTAIGVLLRVLLGEDPGTSERVKSGIDLLVKLPPVWNPKDGSIDIYYWQFGALAMAQLGTASAEAWRASLSKALVEHQRTDGGPCAFQGSWDPIDPWGPDGGRVYMTAMAALALEAPYRYPRAAAK